MRVFYVVTYKVHPVSYGRVNAKNVCDSIADLNFETKTVETKIPVTSANKY